jgi:hypothetical protein
MSAKVHPETPYLPKGSAEFHALPVLRRLGRGWHVFPRVHLQGVGNHLGDSDLDFILLHRDYGIRIIETKDCEVRGIPDDPVAVYRTKQKPVLRQLTGQRRVLGSYLRIDASAIQSCLWARNASGTHPESGQMPNGSVFICGNSIEPILPILELERAPLHNHDQVMNLLVRLSRMTETTAAKRPFSPGDSGLNDQKRFIRGRTKHRLVTGVAGTGKTQVLLQEARHFSGRRENNVLVLCYNERLGESLRESLSGADAQVRTMDQLAREVLGDGYIKPGKDVPYEKNFEMVANRASSGVSPVLSRWTHILVDESQDLSAAQYSALVAIQRCSGAFTTIAHDFTQRWRQGGIDLEDIIRTDWRQGTPTESPFLLKKNLRNGPPIRRAALDFLSRLTPDAPGILCVDEHGEGESHAPEPVEIDSSQIRSVVETILADERNPESALVLTTDTQDWLERGEAGSYPPVFPHEARDAIRAKHPGVLLDTVLRVKGLEAQVVIAFLRRKGRNSESEIRKAYIAATRATRAFYLFWVG